MDVRPLLLPHMVVVGARHLIGKREMTDLAMLVQMPWLQELGTNEVAEWMERQGIVPNRPLMITHMPGSLIMDAVRRGDGLTYTARCFVGAFSVAWDKDQMTDRTNQFEGGCLCGAVRYQLQGAPDWCAHCHCRSCQQATGAAFATWIGVKKDKFKSPMDGLQSSTAHLVSSAVSAPDVGPL